MPTRLAYVADMSMLVQQEIIRQVTNTPATVALKCIVRPIEPTTAAKLPVATDGT